MNAGLKFFSINFQTEEHRYQVYSDYSIETDKKFYGARVEEKEISCGRSVIDHLRTQEEKLGDFFKKD